MSLLKSVVARRWRESGNTRMPGQKRPEPAASAIEYPRGTTLFAHSDYEIDEITVDPTGKLIAFNTKAISHRLETSAANEIYVMPTRAARPGN